MASAYLPRETLGHWHSAQADGLLDALQLVALYGKNPFFDLKGAWPRQSLRGVRFRLLRPHTGEWCLHEVRLYLDTELIHSSPRWSINANPSPGDLPAAFDGNLATRWRTWEGMEAGMFVEAVFDRPQLLDSAVLLSHTPVYGVPVEFQGMALDGKWRPLATVSGGSVRPPEDLRWAATAAVRHAGYPYILASAAASDGNAPLARAFLSDLTGWNLKVAARVADTYLLKIQ